MTKLSREHYVAIAARFREMWDIDPGGIVLIRGEEAYGWKNCLRNPEHEVPGVVAVDGHGNLWLAVGGDAYAGAQTWIPAAFDDEAEGEAL